MYFFVSAIVCSQLGISFTNAALALIIEIIVAIIALVVMIQLYSWFDAVFLDDSTSLSVMETTITLVVFPIFHWTLFQITTLVCIMFVFNVCFFFFERAWE